jgi:uncharacterized protein
VNGKPRYVFDTGVIVSALLFENSIPGQALHAALVRGELLASTATFGELSEVLSRKKFDRYVTRDERSQFLVKFLLAVVLVEPGDVIQVCRDPDDDKLLELAASGRATCLVTGDDDLLSLHPFRDIPIQTPAQFLAALPPDEPAIV